MYLTWKYKVTYVTLHIHFLWHPSVTGIGEITHAQHSKVTGVLTVPLDMQVQAWASQRTSLSSAVFFLKNQFKQNVLLHKNMLLMCYVACREYFLLARNVALMQLDMCQIQLLANISSSKKPSEHPQKASSKSFILSFLL